MASQTAYVTQIDASRYPQVTVYVSVLDPAGRPVAGLGAGDFTLLEEGRPMAVSGFVGGGSSPVSAVLVVDRSGSMEEADRIAGAKRAVRAYADQMRPDDRAALIAFSDEVELLLPFTSEPDALRRAVGPLRPDGATALYDALEAAARQLERAPGRRALVLLTDGRDMVSVSDPRPASRATLAQALDAAAAVGVPVLAIGLGTPGDPGRDGIDEAVLRQIAEESGGAYLPARESAQLEPLYRELAGGLQQEYAITYTSPLSALAPRRSIQVVVGAVASGDYQIVPPLPPQPPAAPEPALPLGLLPFAALTAAFGGALIWRSRRMRERAPRPPAAIGATTQLTPRYCVECGAPVFHGTSRCEACGAPIEV
jgi:Ca-activated chloride channel homolog